MTKWEYATLQFADLAGAQKRVIVHIGEEKRERATEEAVLQKVLAELGKAGWEAFAMDSLTEDSLTILLKRPSQ